MKSVIVIPARYNSTRFPGKPLHIIAGQTMLQRVVAIANQACVGLANTEVIVATDDERIAEHANELASQVIMTPENCLTGSDRALAACDKLAYQADIVLNLQGDAPLTPPGFVRSVLNCLAHDSSIDVATPVVQLNWQALDTLRQQKHSTPFSGTTAIVDKQGRALWFSKHIIPALRKEDKLRQASELSPVFRHIGLYGYRYQALKQFVELPEGHYESLEGLEQLRFLENGMHIQTVTVDYKQLPQMSGVDTLEDAKRAEQLLSKEVPAC